MESLLFVAKWCTPCIAYKPVLAEVFAEYPDVAIREVDIDDNFDLAYQHQIREIPALVMLGPDKVGNTTKLIGAADAETLRSWLNTVTGR